METINSEEAHRRWMREQIAAQADPPPPAKKAPAKKAPAKKRPAKKAAAKKAPAKKAAR